MKEPQENLAELEGKLRVALAAGHGKFFVMTPERIELLAAVPAADRRRVLSVYAEARRG